MAKQFTRTYGATMQPSTDTTRGHSIRLEAGPRWTPAQPCRGRLLQVLAWRLAIAWAGRSGAGTVAWLIPLAVAERESTRVRWRPVPHLTLAVNAFGLALAAWLIFGPGRGTAPRPRRA